MSGKIDIEQIVAAAPPGLIMSGTVDIHKVVHTHEKTGKTSQHVILIGKIGDQEIRKEIQPIVLQFFAGQGPFGWVARKLFGGDAPEPGTDG